MVRELTITLANGRARTLSDLPIPPGEVLEEELEARGMTQKELAVRLGTPAHSINEIIKGEKSITPDTAVMLEKALGIHAQFWTNLEIDYRLTLARNSQLGRIAGNGNWQTYHRNGPVTKRGQRGTHL